MFQAVEVYVKGIMTNDLFIKLYIVGSDILLDVWKSIY